jgi:transposase
MGNPSQITNNLPVGLPLSFYVTPANVHDSFGARCLLAGLKYFVPRLKIIWADQAYQGHDLAGWCQASGDWKLEVVKRPPGVRGWSQQPKRWIVEQMFDWLRASRRSNRPNALLAFLGRYSSCLHRPLKIQNDTAHRFEKRDHPGIAGKGRRRDG